MAIDHSISVHGGKMGVVIMIADSL